LASPMAESKVAAMMSAVAVKATQDFMVLCWWLLLCKLESDLSPRSTAAGCLDYCNCSSLLLRAPP